MPKTRKIVLAYSGGLDTSVMVLWLKEHYRADIIAVAVDLAQGTELKGLKEKALSTGAAKAFILDARKEYVTDYIWKALKANAIYEGKYLLGTSLARPLIAQKIVEVARREGADAVAHGATGKGNDQVRFELTFKALAPDLKIIAPWREWDLRSREDEIQYAQEHGIPVPVTKSKPYSSDRNVWHMSFEGGILENPWNAPPEDMFVLTVSPEKAPAKGVVLEIGFEKGVPVSLNGQKKDGLALVEQLNRLGGQHGIGRVDMVENRLVGIKSRGVYECPGATILYSAHKELESLVLDRQTLHDKELLAPRYGELVYNGQWFTPQRQAWDAYMESTQAHMTGSVRLKLYKGNVIVLGRRSPHSLYWEELATFGQEAIYNQKDAEGFINLYGLPLKVQALLRKTTQNAERRTQNKKEF